MGSRLESNSNAIRKRIEAHTFDNEEGDEYEGSKFGGFPEYFRRKKIKLQNLDAELRSHSTDKPAVFRGVVAHVNGYTQPSLNDLHNLIVSHGGGFMQYLDGKTTVTHIIASSLTPKKIVDFRKYRIVKPAWVVDSVKAGKLLPWDAYRVVDEGERQKVLQFGSEGVKSQVNNRARSYRDQTDASWYTSQLAQNSQIPTPEPSSAPKADAVGSQSSTSFGSNGLDGLREEDLAEVEGLHAGPTVADFDRKDVAVASRGGEAAHEPSTSFLDFDGVDDQDLADFLGLEEEKPLMDDHDDIYAAEIIRPDTPLPVSTATMTEPQQTLTPRSTPPAHATVSFPEHSAPPVLARTSPKPQSEMSLKRPASPSALVSESKKAKLTAEEHNALLLADPHVRKSSTLNPDFLEQYYRESRLHHLSTWKAELKSQLQAQAAEKLATSQKSRQKRPSNARRYVLHVDFDSFFVAVSLKKHPQYKDKPACVAHGGGGGAEIASCNYPARDFGVKNGMWMKRAQELCPDLKVLPYDFSGYEAASRKFYDAMMSIDGIIQSVSIDEALIDVSAICLEAGGTDGTGVREGSIYREQARADELARDLRAKVKADTDCEVSVGIGGNILLAKVALRKAKPAGQYQLKPEEMLSFLGDLEVQSLPGVAYSIGNKLEEIGVKFVKDIRDMSKERLVNVLGPKTGDKIWNYARGIDRQEVGDVVIRKSVSAEVNWGVRFETVDQAEEFVESLCGELTKRLLKEGVKGKQLTMKIMRRAADAPLDPPKHLGHGKCDTFNKSVQLGVATNAKDILAREALSIMRGYGFSPGELRGLGVQMQKLEPIKDFVGGELASSQRRLDFFRSARTLSAGISKHVPEQRAEHVASEQPEAVIEAKEKRLAAQRHLQFKQARPTESEDQQLVNTIEDAPETPRKARMVESTPIDDRASPSRKSLNVLGTQFVLPTQVDPAVLAELPPEIVSKLAKHTKTPSAITTPAPPRPDSPSAKAISYTALPSHSQLDYETLAALPADIRAEIIAHYDTSPTKLARGAQSVLPQSPRKNRIANPPKRSATTTSTRGRPRGGGTFLSRLKGARTTNPTLTQSNFVAFNNRAGSHDATDTDRDTGDERPDSVSAAAISEDFLAALPDDIRREVMAQHRADTLKRTGGLEVHRRRNARQAQAPQQGQQGQRTSEAAGGERVLVLPPRPVRPSFTTQKLTGLAALRDAVSEWAEEFREEGPYSEDVEALGRYLGSVVGEEGDMGKAVAVVKWMEWVLADAIDGGSADGGKTANEMGDGFKSSGIGGSVGTQSSMKWKDALETAKQHVRDAVKARGLGPVAL